MREYVSKRQPDWLANYLTDVFSSTEENEEFICFTNSYLEGISIHLEAAIEWPEERIEFVILAINPTNLQTRMVQKLSGIYGFDSRPLTPCFSENRSGFVTAP